MAFTPEPTLIPYVSQSEVANAADVPNLSEDMANQLHTLISTLQIQVAAAREALVPVGTIVAYGGSVAPVGWVLCDGRLHNSNALSQILPAPGDRTPDLTSRFVVGAGASQHPNSLGVSVYNRGNSKPEGMASRSGYYTLSANEMPRHDHGSFTGNDDPDHSHTLPHNTRTFGAQGFDKVFDYVDYSDFSVLESVNGASARHTHRISTAGESAAFDMRPPYYALVYIIKAGPNGT